MREAPSILLVALLMPAAVLAQEAEFPETVEAARALLDAAAETLGAYEADAEARAAAPDALAQARDTLEQARTRLAESGVPGAQWLIRRTQALLDLVEQLVRARAAEKEVEALADDVVEALERLAVARANYERIVEQLHLHAVPFPGEVGQ